MKILECEPSDSRRFVGTYLSVLMKQEWIRAHKLSKES